MALPKVSVVIPCYNCADTLRETVASIAAQNYASLELLLVNDGSTDGTAALLDELSAALPFARVVEHPHNRGPAAALNTGVAHAQGKYILPCGADDKLSENYISACVAALEQHPECGFAYPEWQQDFGESTQRHRFPEWSTLAQELRIYCHLPAHTLFRRQLWETVGGFCEELPAYEDWDFWLGCVEHGAIGIRVPGITLFYRVRSTGQLRRHRARDRELKARIVLRHPRWFTPAQQRWAQGLLAGDPVCEALDPGVGWLAYPPTSFAPDRWQQPPTTDHPPIISVLMRTRNRPQLLRNALESLRQQRFRNFEVVLVNDGGEDISAVCAEFPELCIRAVQHERQHGVAAALNTAAELAQGEYIAYLDDDDAFEPEHLWTLLAHLQRFAWQRVAYGDAVVVRYRMEENGQLLITGREPLPARPFSVQELSVGNIAPPGCFLHERRCFEEMGFFDERLSTHEDWEFWLRLAHRYRFAHVAAATYQYRRPEHGGSVSDRLAADMLRTARLIHYRYRHLESSEVVRRARAGQLRFLERKLRDAGNRLIPIVLFPPEERGLLQRCLESLHTGAGNVGYTLGAVLHPRLPNTVQEFLRQESEAGRLHLILPEELPQLAMSADSIVLLDGCVELPAGWLEALVQPLQNHPSCALAGLAVRAAESAIANAAWATGVLESPCIAVRSTLLQDCPPKGSFSELRQELYHHARAAGLRHVLVEEPSARALHPSAPPEAAQQPCAAPLVSIIICVHNAWHYTEACLRSILETPTSVAYELIVVDNASTDETLSALEELRQRVPQLRVIRRTENDSFSRANNIGAAHARGEYLLFLNNDTFVQPGWLEALVEEFCAHPETGIQGGRLLYANGRIQHAGMAFGSIGNRPPMPFHLYLLSEADAPWVSRRRPLQFVTGACLGIRRSLFWLLGGFDEGYAWGWEDVDLCVRARQLGWAVVYNPAITVFHFESVTKRAAFSDDAAPQERSNRRRFLTRWSAFVQPDAAALYAEDGFKCENGLPSPSPLLRPDRRHLRTSFDEEFWNRPWATARTALFCLTPSIGDSLLISAIIAQVKQQFPTVRITVCAEQHIQDLLRHHPAVERYIPPGGLEEFLARRSSDIVVDYTLLLAQLPEYYNGIGLWEILANIAGVRLHNPRVHYSVEPEEAEWAARFLGSLRGQIVYGLHLQTERDPKRSYPHIRELLQLLSERFPQALFLLFGSRPLPEPLPERVLDCAALGLTLRQQIALSQHCVAFLCIDSAFFHIARLLWRRPTLLLCGVTNPTLWPWHRPFGALSASGLPCLHCYWQTPCNVECMQQLAPAAIAHAFEQPCRGQLPQEPKPPVVQLQLRAEMDWKVALITALRRHPGAHLVVLAPAGLLPAAAPNWNGVEVQEVQPSAMSVEPKVHIAWEGSQFVYHSLALVNRELARVLLQAGVELSLVPYEPDEFTPSQEYACLRERDIRQRPLPGVPQIWVRHQWPPNPLPPPPGTRWIVMQPYEFGALPRRFLAAFERADEVWTPSSASRLAFVRSGIPPEKVQIIPNGVNPERFRPTGPIRPLPTQKRFRFLFVGGTTFRKGIDILLRAYARAFTAEDDVCLVIKAFGQEGVYRGSTMEELIERFRQMAGAPEIVLLCEHLSDEEMPALYRACTVFVSPYRGEGFSLPTLEAMACGLPVVVTAGGATDDFVDDSVGWRIPARRRSLGWSIDGMETVAEAFVLEPDELALARLLRELYEHPEQLFLKGLNASYRARSQWNWKRAAVRLLARVDFHLGTRLAAQAAERLPDPDDGCIRLGAAEHALRMGKPEAALQLYRRALEDPALPPSYAVRARVQSALLLLAQEDIAGAEELLRQAAATAPDHPDILYTDALLRAYTGEFSLACTRLEHLLQHWQHLRTQTVLGLTAERLLLDLGQFLLLSGTPNAAVTVLEMLPDHPELLMEALEVAQATQAYELAERLSARLARLCGEPTAGAATLSAPTALPAAPLPPQQ